MFAAIMYTTSITLSKDFLINAHGHPLLASVNKMPKEMLQEIFSVDVKEYIVSFCGSYNHKFKSDEDYAEFEAAFDAILKKHGVDERHKYSLYYYITFFNQDVERQSVTKSAYNSLLKEARFLLDLVVDSKSYFDKLIKSTAYQLVEDEESGEQVFVKKDFLKANPGFSAAYHINDPKRPDEVIRFTRLLIYQTVVHLHLQPNFTFKRNIERKTSKGKPDNWIELPKTMRLSLFVTIVDNILKAQKHYNTLFYQEFNRDGGYDLYDINRFSKSYYKNNISYTDALTRIGKVVSEYLMAHAGIRTQTAAAAFLFEYFALFKVYNIEKRIPNDYLELANFYKENGITSERIRTMLKDADKAGEISVSSFFDH
jgi:hypothetical protein